MCVGLRKDRADRGVAASSWVGLGSAGQAVGVPEDADSGAHALASVISTFILLQKPLRHYATVAGEQVQLACPTRRGRH